ncbi:unnamed protein product [Moneuplotes crassus]|uniref:C2H2-type domain-containing protein n=1 Tax=Euplotes crassus TaxID=5936 RepID=A0AAD2D4G7_EUPCR|nr:unnamed protein product [Moneuplotes crassus]
MSKTTEEFTSEMRSIIQVFKSINEESDWYVQGICRTITNDELISNKKANRLQLNSAFTRIKETLFRSLSQQNGYLNKLWAPSSPLSPSKSGLQTLRPLWNSEQHKEDPKASEDHYRKVEVEGLKSDNNCTSRKSEKGNSQGVGEFKQHKRQGEGMNGNDVEKEGSKKKKRFQRPFTKVKIADSKYLYICQLCSLDPIEHIDLDKKSNEKERQKEFSTKNWGLFRSHLALHKKNQVFDCPVCKMVLKNKFTLYSHVRTHWGTTPSNRPYHCPIPTCDVTSHRSDYLNKHYRFHLTSLPPSLHPKTPAVIMADYNISKLTQDYITKVTALNSQQIKKASYEFDSVMGMPLKAYLKKAKKRLSKKIWALGCEFKSKDCLCGVGEFELTI